MSEKLHTEDRKKFVLDTSFFTRAGKTIRWLCEKNFNCEYLFFLRKYGKVEKSRESLGRKVGRHPAQIARYEGMGYAQQIPNLEMIRKLVVLLQANPILLLNLQLHFDNKEDAINWLKSCCDGKTRKMLDEQ